MAKGPIVTPEVEVLIASVHDKHPKWKAPQIRNTVEGILRKKNPKLPKGWPSLSKVQKILAQVKRHLEEPSREDMLWSLGTLNEYPISPEVIPYVLDVWKLRVARGETFTIREAKWVARLSGFQLQELIITKKWSLKSIKSLAFVAGGYARLELLIELLGLPVLCSTGLDKLLMSIPDNVHPCPVCAGMQWDLPEVLALEGHDTFRKGLEHLKAREYQEFHKLEGQLYSKEEEEKEEDELAQEIEQDWEEYKKEAQNERTHNQESQG